MTRWERQSNLLCINLWLKARWSPAQVRVPSKIFAVSPRVFARCSPVIGFMAPPVYTSKQPPQGYGLYGLCGPGLAFYVTVPAGAAGGG